MQKVILVILSVMSFFIPINNNAQEEDNYAARVKNEFIRSWNDYKKYAWGKDEFLPLTKSYSNWYGHSLFISPIDAYSTMRVMGLDEEAKLIENYIIDSVDFNKDIFVKTFEVNIRVLGGLCAMYQYTMNKKILTKAEDFAKRLLPAFNSPSRIPYYWVNLKTGETKGDTVNVAEAGSYLIEMGVISRFTKNPVYYRAAKKATEAIYDRRSKLNLIAEVIDVNSGKWITDISHIGCCIDSYYEYLLKASILFDDFQLREIWNVSYEAINKYVKEEHDGKIWYGQVNMNTGETVSGIVTLYDAYFPAVVALSGNVAEAGGALSSWNYLWDKYCFVPTVYDYGKDEIINAEYNLNPEVIESTYYLYHFTKDPKYIAAGKKYFDDYLKYCKYDIGFTSLKNIVTKERKNDMPTFFFAETMKYFYLLFSPEEKFNFEDYIFSTEAHPFKKGHVRQK